MKGFTSKQLVSPWHIDYCFMHLRIFKNGYVVNFVIKLFKKNTILTNNLISNRKLKTHISMHFCLDKNCDDFS